MTVAGAPVELTATEYERKLGESVSSPAYLLNERGVGYRMAKPPKR